MYVVAHSPRLHCHTKSATPVLTQDAFRALARDGSSTTAVTTAIITVARSAQPYGGTPHIPWRVLRCDVPAASSKAAIEEGLVLFLGGVGGGGGEARRGRSHLHATVTHTVVGEAVVKGVAARRGVRNGLSAVLALTPGGKKLGRGEGGNGATNHGSNNCGAVSLLRTSVEGSTEQGNTADYYFTTHSHTTTISRTMEKDFSQAVTAEGKVNNLSPLSRSVSRRGTQRRGRRRKRWQVGGVAPPTPMFRGM